MRRWAVLKYHYRGGSRIMSYLPVELRHIPWERDLKQA
jgi:hypothetical protein